MTDAPRPESGQLTTVGDMSPADALADVDLVVAVAARDQDGAIVELLEAAAAALDKHLHAEHGAVVALETARHAPTGEAVRAWCAQSTTGARRLLLSPRQPLREGDAQRTLLGVGGRAGVTGCLLVDGDLTGVPAEALAALLEPVVQGLADAVMPAYTRVASDGTLTTNLLRPAMLAFYGRDLQQLVGGATALAGPLAGRLAEERPPLMEAPGSEVWLTTALAAADARLAQVHVGRRPAGRPGVTRDLPGILAATVGPLFARLEEHAGVWEARPDRLPVATLGESAPMLPMPVLPDVAPMVRAFRLGVKDLSPIWEQIMLSSTLADLYPLALLEPDEFRFSPSLWARVVADFAVAYHERRLPTDHLLRSLTPLYLGRVAAFLLTAWRQPAEAVTAALTDVARAFESERPAMAARWR
jgi:hypothetical protein